VNSDPLPACERRPPRRDASMASVESRIRSPPWRGGR
jgi:hypothetical protein